jgi:predicted transglutaminase-like cysteine proteinase
MPEMKSLREVNAAINESRIWVTDQEQFGVNEYWEENLANPKVDCDDCAIQKFHALRAEGYPLDVFKLGFCRTIKGDPKSGHLVLIVTENGEDLVLCNLLPYPTPWDRVSYEWDRFYVVSEGRWKWFGGKA